MFFLFERQKRRAIRDFSPLRASFVSYVISSLAQEPFDDPRLGLLLGQAQRAELQDLFARNLADGGLVNQRRIAVVRAELGAASTVASPSMIASHSLWPVQARCR